VRLASTQSMRVRDPSENLLRNGQVAFLTPLGPETWVASWTRRHRSRGRARRESSLRRICSSLRLSRVFGTTMCPG
jgi:hypothetical protein